MFTQRVSKLIIALFIVSFMFSSCDREADIEIVDPEVKASLDSDLDQALEMMDKQPTMALQQLDEVIKEAEGLDSKFYSGKAKWYKAYIYDDIIEDVSQAYHYYNEALKDVLQTNDASLKVAVYNNLGILYRYYGQHDAAIDNYEAAIELEKDLSTNDLSDVYYNYGVALKLKGDSASFFRAEEAFTQSLEYAKQIENHGNIASIYNQIGLMYKAIGNYEMARIAYNNTINTYITNPDLQEYVGKAYHGIGVTYMDEGNAAASVRAFEKALEYKRSSGSIFITKYDLGTVLLRDGQANQAIDVWEDALNEKHDKNSVEQVQIYSDLTAALTRNNQLEEALVYSEIYNENIQQILAEGEKYKTKSDQVLFANVVTQYEEFNRPVPLLMRPIVLISMLLAIGALIYVVVVLYYRSKSKKKVSRVVSEIQNEFLHIKVD